jgi:hypothetical protein
LRPHLIASLFVVAACAPSTEGPTPKLVGTVNPRQPFTNPANVCNAQGSATPELSCKTPEGARGWCIILLGERFTPIPADVLTGEPAVGLPEVTLKGPVTLTLDRSRVFYRDADRMFLDIPTRDTTPPAELPPGHYALQVKNLGGGTAELADLLVVVPPPQVTRVTAPQGFISDGISPIVVEGTNFRPDTFPVMKLRRTGAEEVEVFTLAVDTPTRISTELPPGTPEGTYDFVLTNPEGCSFTLPNALTVSYP